MTIKPEFEEIFKEIEFEITLFPDENIKKRFKTIKELQEFMQTEVEFWRNYQGDLKRIYNLAIAKKNDLQNILIEPNTEKFRNQIIGFKNDLLNNRGLWYSQSSKSQFLAELHEQGPKVADGAFSFFRSKNLVFDKQTDTNILKGIFSAFLFEYSDEAFLAKKKAEKLSFSQIRAKLQKTIDDTEIKFTEFSESVDEKMALLEKETDKWKKEKEQSYNKSYIILEKKFTDLEELYKEKLRLEGPANYWEKMHIDYEKKGNYWKRWSIFSSSFLIILLTMIFFNFPKWLIPNAGKWNLTTLKGTIILGIIISIAVYLIKFFIKLSTSAFHLSRDALERYQLTHSYLALAKEEGILQDSDRKIIIQALFSRADTGLLKGDSSPTMPGNIISNLITKDT